jgi:hypothetical protein
LQVTNHSSGSCAARKRSVKCLRIIAKAGCEVGLGIVGKQLHQHEPPCRNLQLRQEQLLVHHFQVQQVLG